MNLLIGSSLFLKSEDLIPDPIIVTNIPLSFSDFVKNLPTPIFNLLTSLKLWSPASTEMLGFVTSDLYFNSAILVTVVLTLGAPFPWYLFKNSDISLYLNTG